MRLPPSLPDHLRPIPVEAPHPASLDREAIVEQLSMSRGRTSGPGGQHRNRVQTLVAYTHQPTGLSASAGERRSPAENARVALRRMRLELATRARVTAPESKPSALWLERCHQGRIACNPEHWDHPAMLAEALDHVHALHFDQRAAAAMLECSATQLIRLIATHPPALAWLNDAREHRGQNRLRG